MKDNMCSSCTLYVEVDRRSEGRRNDVEARRVHERQECMYISKALEV